MKAKNLKRKDYPFICKEDVKEVEIHIGWIKSKAWGMNPHATCYVELKNGSFFSKNGFAVSGWGYGKESSVVAQVCNDILSGMLYRALNNKRKREKIPYGISNRGFFPYFGGGVGMTGKKLKS